MPGTHPESTGLTPTIDRIGSISPEVPARGLPGERLIIMFGFTQPWPHFPEFRWGVEAGVSVDHPTNHGGNRMAMDHRPVTDRRRLRERVPGSDRSAWVIGVDRVTRHDRLSRWYVLHRGQVVQSRSGEWSAQTDRTVTISQQSEQGSGHMRVEPTSVRPSGWTRRQVPVKRQSREL